MSAKTKCLACTRTFAKPDHGGVKMFCSRACQVAYDRTGGMKRISCMVDMDFHHRVEDFAEDMGFTIEEIVYYAVKGYIDEDMEEVSR